MKCTRLYNTTCRINYQAPDTFPQLQTDATPANAASAIKLQFLIETMTLSLLGRLIGVLLGVGASQLVAAFADFHAIVSVGSILLSFGVSFAIGVFFGFYPANKAAALDPIEALRYE